MWASRIFNGNNQNSSAENSSADSNLQVDSGNIADREEEPQPEIMAPPVNYDAHHADDEADNAMDKAINSLKNLSWMADDIKFYFAQIEVKMKQAGVKSNFTKLQILSTVVPQKVMVEIKSLLMKQESEFPNKDAYLQAKTKILQIFGNNLTQDSEKGFEFFTS